MTAVGKIENVSEVRFPCIQQEPPRALHRRSVCCSSTQNDVSSEIEEFAALTDDALGTQPSSRIIIPVSNLLSKICSL